MSNSHSVFLRMRWDKSVIRAITMGLVVIAIAFAVSCFMQARYTATLADDVATTLRQQCTSYDKLLVSDQTKSIFRLTAVVQDLSEELGGKEHPVDDAYLRACVKNLRLSGIAVLNSNMKLEASGYTRRFKNSEWMNSSLGTSISNIVEHPAKVFAERVSVDGDYYDVCAVARKDAPGVVIGFYKQPAGLVASTESDLASLLTGLRLEREGDYVIAQSGAVRAASDANLGAQSMGDSDVTRALEYVANDEDIHLMRAGNGAVWGYKTASGDYDIYVYYPFGSVVSNALLSTGIVGIVYLVLCLGFFMIRGRALYRNQAELEKSNRELSETVEMLKSLETIFFTLFRVDLTNNRYETIYLAPWLEGAIRREGVYTDLRQLFLDTLVVPEHRAMMDERMSNKEIKEKLSRKAINDVHRSFYVDYQAMRGGQRRWCRMTATSVDYDNSGYPSHVLVLLQDVDEEKAKEAAYQERILKESHVAKVANEAKTEFLRRISHDIRTPINGIRGYVELAGRHPEDVELQQRCRDNEIVAIDTLMSLVNSVLDMVKLEGREINLVDAPFDLEKLFEDTLTVLQPQASSLDIECSVDIEDNELNGHLIGSARHVGQVLMNLMGNGIKYGKHGGYVRLNARLVERADERVTYEFVCEDNGIGMSREFQERMFEPFAQENAGARTVYGGSGLGLSIVKRLVEAMGGSIGVSSEKGMGTTFTVRLPFGIDEDSRPKEEKLETDADALRGKNVLLVEDNELNMEIATFLLEDCGAKVVKAWDGKEALDAFVASRPGRFDLIITDVMMPVMDGLEEARQIRALERDDAKRVPIVAVSANAFSEDARAGCEAGIDAYIAKPIETEKLLRVVSGLLEKQNT